MATALNSSEAACSRALSTSHTGRLDGVVVVTCALVIWNTCTVLLKIVHKLFCLNNVCVTVIESRISLLAGNVQTLETEVCINSKK